MKKNYFSLGLFYKKFIATILIVCSVSAIFAQTLVNGNLGTSATSLNGTAAPAGTIWHELQNVTGNTTESNSLLGVGHVFQGANNFTLADDFVVPAGSAWLINSLTMYSLDQVVPPTGTTSPYNNVRVRIWSGVPGAVGSTIVFGDLTTNRFTSTAFSGRKGIFNSQVPTPAAPGPNLPIFSITANLGGILLSAGTYWAEWQVVHTSGCFSPTSQTVGVRTQTGFNARQSNAGLWIALVDAGNPASAPDVAVDLPFSLGYTIAAACTGTPDPGNTFASAQAVCGGTSVNFSVLYPTGGTGVTYQWETATVAAGPWTNATGISTTSTYTVTPIASLFYRLRVTCGANSANSTPVQVTVSSCACLTPDVATICEGSIQRLSVTIPAGTVQTFTSTPVISIPPSGIATPYPSTLVVSGVAAGATVQSVRINGLTHSWPTDVDIAITSPLGVSQTIMSDVGGITPGITNATYTLSDAATASLTTGASAPGTYKPTNIGAIDNFPAPGPGATFDNATPLMSNFTGNHNGNWNLYVIDDVGGDFGSMNGYSITFASPLPTAIWTGGTFFTDAAATIPYVAGTPATVVWVRPTTTTTYTATIASGSCAGANNVTVTVLPRPALSVSPLTSCGSPLNMLTASGAPVYNWTPGLGLNTTTGAMVTANPATTTTYTVEGTGTNGCKSTASSLVNASPISATISAVGGSIFQVNETFTGVVPPTGWSIRNNSAPIGITSWFKAAATSPFPSPNGGTDFNYAAANFQSGIATGPADLSTWFLTPQVNIKNGDVFTFKTRTTTGTFADRLQVRLSTNGASVNVGTTTTSVGDFTTLLLDVNPTLTATGYPLTWTTFTVTISGITGTVPGRLAFRYFVPNGGGGANSDFIGVDDVQYSTPASVICPNVVSNIKVDVVGGVGPYTVVYSNGASNATFPSYVSGSNIQVTPATTTTYSIVSITGANGCVIPVSGIGAGVAINVTQPVAITTQPANRSICVGANTTFVVVPSTLSGTTYQWELNTVPSPGTPVWTPIVNGGVYNGATTATLTVTGATLSMQGYSYRVAVNGFCGGTPTSSAATLTVVSPAGGTLSVANATVCSNASANIPLVGTITGGPGFTHQWQVSTNGGVTYTNIANGANYSGANTATLTVINPTVVPFSGYRFRDSVNTVSSCGDVISSAGILTVNPAPVVTISAAPITKLFPGLTTTLTAAVSPNAAASYQWFRNGVAVAGATANRYVVTIDALGVYSVAVTDVNTCAAASGVSTPASITISDSVNTSRLFIYPSPNSGQFQVRHYTNLGDGSPVPAAVNVYDEKGSLVFNRAYTVGGGYQPMTVTLSPTHGRGIYRVDLVDTRGGRIKTGSVIIF